LALVVAISLLPQTVLRADLVNRITQPGFWVLVVAQGATLPYPVTLVVAEPTILLVEAALIYLLRGKQFEPSRAFLLSLVVNGTSALTALLLAL
jgi:hypothetical protein